MGTANKSFSLLLVVSIVASSLWIIQPASSQSIPKPSVPEFSVQYIIYSSYVSPTYGIDQCTGKNITIQGGYQVNTRTSEFTIKNQPFTPYIDASGHSIELFYNFRYKGHFGDTWSYYPFTDAYSNVNPTVTEQTTHSYGPYGGGHFIYYTASSSQNTIITIPMSLLTPFPGGPEIPDGSQVDFQVQAQIGQINPMPTGMLAGDFYNFSGQTSSWSNIQTITLDAASTSTTSSNPTPTLTPTLTPTTTLTLTPTLAPTLLRLFQS
jgi:hypothetical protein